MNDEQIKNKMKSHFSRDYNNFYPAKTLESLGFCRNICTKCGKNFWSIQPRDFCDEPACSGGYRFINQTITKRKFGYKEVWDVYVDAFKKWDYVPLDRYPVVCRWYDDLYFVTAGINDFQPYVVSGEVEPPADAVIEPQFCLRFQDIDSVGITGRHYTGFIMVGQHVFNTPDKYVYFKEEGIAQIYEFLTKELGIPPHELYFHEDVWAGGGNFGPSMEFFSRGLELGNQVYMQYQSLPDGSYKELQTQVIDMGAGLERWSWLSQGTPMSYDTVFPGVMKYLYKYGGAPPDFWSKFAGYAGLLNRMDDSRIWTDMASHMDIEPHDLKEEVYRMRSLYALGDHTRTLLVALHDGALPSNVGGGYNLRNILRRCWSLIEEYDINVELEDLFKLHIDEFGKWFTELRDYGSLFEILQIERRRYDEALRKGRNIVQRLAQRKEKFDVNKLVELYDSQGISPTVIREFDQSVTIPDDFYHRVQMRHEKQDVKVDRTKYDVTGICPTKMLYYEKPAATKFTAKATKWIAPTKIILDRTLFYPSSGGQMHDTGTLNGVKVLDVIKEDGVVIHITEKPIEGDVVEGVIDAERRKVLSEHHTATHIVNYAARKVLGEHIWQAGAEKTLEKARLDITHYDSLDIDQLQEIERAANELVKRDIPVRIMECQRGEAESRYSMRIYQGGAVPGKTLRIVAIDDYDVEACGGTHVRNTSQVGLIKIINSERIQDGVVRLEFVVGDNAMKEIQHQEKILKELSDLWGVSRDDIPKTAKKFFEEWKGLKKENARLKEELAKARISDMVNSARKVDDVRLISRTFADADIEELIKMAPLLAKGDVVVILASSKDGAKIVVSAGPVAVKHGIDSGAIVRELSKMVGGGGGGKPGLAQGGGPKVERLDGALGKGAELVKKQMRP